MAVQQPQPQPVPPESQPRSRAAGLAWAIAAVALIISASTGSAFLAYLMFNRQIPVAQQVTGESVVSRTGAAYGAEAAAVAPLGPTLDAGEFVVNLAPGSGGLSIRYARVGVTVEADRREVVDELSRREPQVRDTIIAVIRTKRFEDLTSTAGTEAVRQELVQALQRLVTKGRVVNVYFTELVIQ
ncbi:MAG TPA: flagellar basal body-associated FliL family protein [Limnochordales bacterium]|mgnify:CR=1 FL=1